MINANNYWLNICLNWRVDETFYSSAGKALILLLRPTTIVSHDTRVPMPDLKKEYPLKIYRPRLHWGYFFGLDRLHPKFTPSFLSFLNSLLFIYGSVDLKIFSMNNCSLFHAHVQKVLFRNDNPGVHLASFVQIQIFLISPTRHFPRFNYFQPLFLALEAVSKPISSHFPSKRHPRCFFDSRNAKEA